MSFARQDAAFPVRGCGGWRSLVFLLSASGAGGRAAAQTPPLASEPVFTGLLVDGKPVSGRITAFSTDGSRSWTRRTRANIVPIRSLVKLFSRDPSRSQAIEGSHVLLPDGDRFMRVSSEPRPTPPSRLNRTRRWAS